mmetsp:Transcript_48592/g.96928  ORF Transcript_48592/g.96928 Transcript_48592/m.96928 type:complete len:84 (-) Transcript_48592:1873-2124(-)
MPMRPPLARMPPRLSCIHEAVVHAPARRRVDTMLAHKMLHPPALRNPIDPAGCSFGDGADTFRGDGDGAGDRSLSDAINANER